MGNNACLKSQYLGELKQEDPEFKTSLGNITRLYLKRMETVGWRQKGVSSSSSSIWDLKECELTRLISYRLEANTENLAHG